MWTIFDWVISSQIEQVKAIYLQVFDKTKGRLKAYFIKWTYNTNILHVFAVDMIMGDRIIRYFFIFLYPNLK